MLQWTSDLISRRMVTVYHRWYRLSQQAYHVDSFLNIECVSRYESVIATLCENLDSLDEPEARAAMIWIVGEYAERIDNADELLESFLEGFHDESTQVNYIKPIKQKHSQIWLRNLNNISDHFSYYLLLIYYEPRWWTFKGSHPIFRFLYRFLKVSTWTSFLHGVGKWIAKQHMQPILLNHNSLFVVKMLIL